MEELKHDWTFSHRGTPDTDNFLGPHLPNQFHPATKNCSFTIIPISEGTRGIADNYKSIISHSSYTPLILPPFFKTDLTAGLVLF
jgi:hypothetical protein